MRLRDLELSDAERCIEVVRSLPQWFGYPGAIENIRGALAREEGTVALDDSGALAGFVTTRRNFAESLEITYLAVHAARRHGGVGTALVAEVGRRAEHAGVALVCLLTLGPSAGSPHYDETVAFYRARHFLRVRECRLAEWGGAPALLMAARAGDLVGLA